jgi:hypothetical protein
MCLLRLFAEPYGNYEIPFVSRESPGRICGGAVASSGANDQILEGVDSFKNGGWLRQCANFPGDCCGRRSRFNGGQRRLMLEAIWMRSEFWKLSVA